ncbi:MAG: TonB-dependent receptor [Halieaceae bacterium]|jgi:iron complex outermembrane recepter protein|nr:TonB-dependent receptor [Halieaceae bacterium]
MKGLERALIVVGIAGTLIAKGAFAAELEEVIVTAQKRAQSMQDVPISLNAVTGESIRNKGMQNMEDLAVGVPNLNISDSPGVNYIVIRGLGSGAGTISFEQSVGMYVDGIYAGRAALFQAPFLDIERVEVLRGAQGVLFGKNSIAGAVSVITARPSDTFEAEVSGRYEFEDEGFEVSGFASGPLSDGLYGRIVLKSSESGPYVDNEFIDDAYPVDEADVMRGTLVWDASDATSVMFKAETSRYEEEGTTYQISHRDYATPLPPFPGSILVSTLLSGMEAGGEDFKLNSKSFLNEMNTLKQDASNYTLEVSHALGEFELTYLGGYSKYTRKEFKDMDFSAPEFLKWRNKEVYEQTSHELRITSPLTGKLNYVAGLFYFDRELKLPETPLDLNAPIIASSHALGYREETESWSAFAQGTWSFSDTLRATLGVRYSSEDKDARASHAIYEYESSSRLLENPLALSILQEQFGSVNYQNEASRHESDLDPTFNLQWDFSDAAMLYFTWAKASKAGGFNSSDRTGSNFEYEDESAENLEIGLKSDLLEGVARVNLAVFYTEFSDLQVSSFNGSSFEVGNAAQATSQGFELELTYLLGERWTLGANAAHLDATYDQFESACPPNPNQWRGSCAVNDGVFQDMSGESLEFAPEWSGNIFADFQVPIGDNLVLSARVDAVYQDEIHVHSNLDEHLVQDPFWKYNMRVAVASADERWLIAVSGLNLGDEKTMNFGGQSLGLPGVYFSNYESPRRIELSVSYRFGK